MDTRDRHLLHKLAAVLLLKLLVLTALWWGFVRDQRVPVDAGRAALQVLGTPGPASPTHPTGAKP
jgi:hypothetical protein